MLKIERAAGEHTRGVPVHPELARVLRGWRATGYEQHCGKRPPDDALIIPTHDGRHHSRTSFYLAWRTACDRAEVKNRSVDSTRKTFITVARRAVARTEVVEKLTHNAGGKVIDTYTHRNWAPLCEAIQRLALEDMAAYGAAPVVPQVVPSIAETPCFAVLTQGFEPNCQRGLEWYFTVYYDY